MKHTHSNSAFTLIELITVIAIIAILMGLLIPQIAGAKESARRTKAATEVKTIVQASKAYYNDYGKFPPVEEAKSESGSSGGGKTTNTYMSFGDVENAKCKVENNILFDILRAIARGDNEDHAYNKRQQKYIALGAATDKNNPRDGFVDGADFPKEKQGMLMDPWGTQFCVILETDGNEEIDMGEFFQDLAGESNVVRYSAVAFSMAKDGKIGGKGYEGKLRKKDSSEAPDDVVSWSN